MSGSLRDQLIGLGLAKPGRDTASRNKRKPSAKKSAKSSKNPEISLEQAYRLRVQEEKRSAEQRKQEKRARDLAQRKINEKIRELTEGHQLNDPQADIKRNFLYKGRIRSVLVTQDQLARLNQGELGLVFLRGRYALLDKTRVERARAISPDHVPDLCRTEEQVEEEGDHSVPDDLIW